DRPGGKDHSSRTLPRQIRLRRGQAEGAVGRLRQFGGAPPDPADREQEGAATPADAVADPDDNRITFGCINVPSVFYSKSLRPLFQRKGGYVYVLPDTKPLEAVFPRVRVQGPT